MKTLTLSLLLVGAIGATTVFAAVPSGAPSGTMGMCKDGTYSSSPEKKGACRGHKGVKEWYGEDASPAAKPTSERAPASPPSSMATTTTTTARTTSPAMAGRTSMEPAAGGGAGKVWANTSTKVYHCSGDKYYGATEHGEYMSESDAKAKGYHADHGKVCG